MKWIKGYEGRYKIGSNGKIFSVRRNVRLMPAEKGGYLNMGLCKDGKRFCTTVHRLLALAFIPNPQNLPEVNHKNGIKSDNRIENLEWVSHSQNQVHARRLGLNGGERYKTAKLNRQKVTEIRGTAEDFSAYEMAKKYGVSRRTIRDVISNRNWKYV